MDKSPDAFRTISEVADWLGVQAHVLRFWESKFTQVKPVKRAGGRRYYRPADMMLLGGIKKLLHEDGMTIKGVQKILREQGVPHVSEMSQSLDDMAVDGSKPRRAQTVLHTQSSAVPPEPAAPTDKQVEMALETYRSESDISEAAGRSGQPAPKPVLDPQADPLIEGPAQLLDEPEDAPTVAHAFEAEPASPEAPVEAAPEPEAEAVQPDEEPAPDPVPTFRRHTAPRPDSVPEPAVDAAEPEMPQPQKDPATESPAVEADVPAAEVAPTDAPTGPRPRIVDAQDPPADDEVDAQAGPLGLLAPIGTLGPEQIAALLPLVRELEAWHSTQLPKHAAQ